MPRCLGPESSQHLRGLHQPEGTQPRGPNSALGRQLSGPRSRSLAPLGVGGALFPVNTHHCTYRGRPLTSKADILS